jgi:hypothetical protein
MTAKLEIGVTPIPGAIGPYRYRLLKGGPDRVGPMWLTPEPLFICCEGDIDPGDKEAALDYWLSHLRKKGISTREIPIRWFVECPSGLEGAPYEDLTTIARWDGLVAPTTETFLDVFSVPAHEVTGASINWFALPVVSEYDALDALGITLAPLQPTLRLDAILAARRGLVPRR